MVRGGLTMEKWKDIVQYGTAVASMASGIVLANFNYFNSGDIASGVLGYVAQTLIYAGSIFGVTMYWNSKYGELKSVIQHNRKDDNTNMPVGNEDKTAN